MSTATTMTSPIDQMISHAWDLAERAQTAEVPRPVLGLLVEALWHLEDHLDYGDGDLARCVIAAVQSAVVVGRWLA